MPILVATDREVIIVDIERGTSRRDAASVTVLRASLRTLSLMDGRGVARIATECSGQTMVDGPGSRLVLPAV